MKKNTLSGILVILFFVLLTFASILIEEGEEFVGVFLILLAIFLFYISTFFDGKSGDL